MSYARFRDQLIDANRHDLFPPEWFDHQVSKGLLVPFTGDASAMLVGVRVFPSGRRVAHIPAAIGDLDELRDALGPNAIKWALGQNCKLATIEGRPGWSRAMKDHGWEHHQSVLLKEL